MKLHPESGQIKVMVADWSCDTLSNVQYHFAIQGTFYYLNNDMDVPLDDLEVYDVNAMASEVDSYYAEMLFDGNDISQIRNIIELMYAGELYHWNAKIIEADRVANTAQNWAMLGYLI